MKKLTFLICLLCFLTFKLTAQDKVQVEKSLWGIHVGSPIIAVYNESRLANKFVLRTEVAGTIPLYASGDFFSPFLKVEPRYYYNLSRRVSKGKVVEKNIANYFSLELWSNFGLGTSIRDSEGTIHPVFCITPTYGLRRKIGKHFIFETSIGLGSYFQGSALVDKGKANPFNMGSETETGLSFSTRLGIGYCF